MILLQHKHNYHKIFYQNYIKKSKQVIYVTKLQEDLYNNKELKAYKDVRNYCHSLLQKQQINGFMIC